jgi:hypothetical protein
LALGGKNLFRREVSGFCHEEDENCALLGYYAMISGNFLPTFRDIGPIFGVQEDGAKVDPKRRQEITTTRCVKTQKIAVLNLV